MIKRILPVLLLGAATLLAACSPGATTGKSQQSGPPMACSVVDIIPKPNPTIEALIPAVTDKDHSLGPKEATVTFVEYSDYQ